MTYSPGVAEMIDLVNVDAQFDDGLKTVTVWQPVRPGIQAADTACRPGEIAGWRGRHHSQRRQRQDRTHCSQPRRPADPRGQPLSLFEANRDLEFDRAAAFGKRLDLPAGASARFDPGEHRTVMLTAIAGSGDIQGFNRLTEGNIHDPDVRERALARARERGFRGA